MCHIITVIVFWGLFFFSLSSAHGVRKSGHARSHADKDQATGQAAVASGFSWRLAFHVAASSPPEHRAKQRNRSCLLWSATGFTTGTRTSVWSEKLNEKTRQTLTVIGRHCGRSLKMKVSTPFIVGLWTIYCFFVSVCMHNGEFSLSGFEVLQKAHGSSLNLWDFCHKTFSYTHTHACAHLRTPKHREMFLPLFKVG